MKSGIRGLSILVGTTAVTLAAMSLSAVASPTPAAGGAGNPYSPSAGHPYRHGAVPTLSQNAKMKSYAAAHPSAVSAATGPETLSYGGGIDGIGVQSGHSKVYLVFYGTQWGTQSTDANGNLTFSGDAKAGAPVAQNMFKGIGTNNELWSAELTQWCDGPNVSTGATSCPANANFIPYQAGGVLSGVWYDNSAASPSAASGHQLGVEAVKAASHFGNTTAAANRDAYYVVLSPHGTNPDSYQGQYCAWHDYNGDSTLSGGGAVASSVGDVAFSNQPYNMDSGAGCGVGFANSPGTLDGWTMTLGHEWQEMMSDQNPAGGWTNHTGSSFNGQENSDECAWIAAGTAGGAANITFATGTFTEQASWSNDTNNCAITHPIVGGGGGGNTVTVTNPGSKTGTVGTATSLQISATDSGTGTTLTYSATGLPTGLSINASTGLISGTPSAAGSFSVTAKATDNTGASGTATFTWTISGGGGGNTVTVTNPGSKTGTVGTATSLQISATDSGTGTTLTYSATGLPTGLSINASTGLISGTPSAAGSFSVTAKATDNTGASGTATFTWTISGGGGGGCSGQILKNGGFESGSTSWSATAGVINTDGAHAHSGTGYAWLDGYGSTHTDTLSQSVTIPAGCAASLTYYLYIQSSEGTTTAYDKLTLTANGTVVRSLSNVSKGTGYVARSVNLSAFAGQTVTLKWTGTEDSSLTTSFFIDDQAVTLS